MGIKIKFAFVFSDDKNPPDLVSLEVERVSDLAVSRRLLIFLFFSFENAAQFLQHLSADLPSVLQRDSADTFRSRAALTQGSNLRVNNAGTQREKDVSGCTALKHEYIFTFGTRIVMF